MKKARVTPLLKSGGNFVVNNYRPISVLKFVSKIIEWHVFNSYYYKLLIFLFWCVNKYYWFELLFFPCRLHRQLFCFVKCFIVISNELFHQFLWNVWPYCDKYVEFIVRVLKKSSNFRLNLLHFCEYLNIYTS